MYSWESAMAGGYQPRTSTLSSPATSQWQQLRPHTISPPPPPRFRPPDPFPLSPPPTSPFPLQLQLVLQLHIRELQGRPAWHTRLEFGHRLLLGASGHQILLPALPPPPVSGFALFLLYSVLRVFCTCIVLSASTHPVFLQICYIYRVET